VLISLIALVGCGGGSDLDQPSNEKVNGGEIVVNFPASAIKASLMQKGLVDADTAVYGYKGFKVPYTTTDEQGNEVSASGLFVLPTGMPEAVSSIGYSLVSDDHGTLFSNRESPSVMADRNATPEGSPIILSSLGGFITLQPDYIGFGDSSDHYHPFVLKKSLANSTIDFIKAAKTFAKNNNINLNGQLFLTGYSEGGYASLATLQKIEDDGVALDVTMTAPMAGPYALKTMSDVVLSQPKLTVPSFMANVGYAYAKTYDEPVDSVINEPYASILPELFNGEKTRAQIDPKLTQTTTGDDGLFVQTFITDYFTNDTNWFKQAVADNSVAKWVPKSAVKLVHCKGDDVIPYAIAELTAGTMQAMGAQGVSIVPVESTLGLPIELGHADCGTYAYMLTTQMFAQARHATIGY